jgi:ribonuclease P protein component
VRGRRSFADLARTKRRARSGPVRVHFLPAEQPDDLVRVAYSIGRNVGPAVVRNHWRRRLRAVAAELAPELRPGKYLIGVAPDVNQLSFGELRERVGESMRRASGAGR